ncbi:MAG: DUF1461 domain-containing protein [Chloroflexi bacterium]|nr:DUF1461 domain-containing protein [Chloroflexota bacterium]
MAAAHTSAPGASSRTGCYNSDVDNVAATVDKAPASPRARVARALSLLALALFLLAIPTFLVTSDVRWAFGNLRLYRYGFEQYNVTRSTGLSMPQLMEVAREIRDYFSSSQEFLDVKVVLDGEDRPLFNQGEIAHMRDVKGLVRGVYRAQEIAGAYIVAYMGMVLVASRGRSARLLAGRVMGGSLLTLGLVAFVGLVSVVGFRFIFQQFHVLSFTSGTWAFDPRYNYLTRLFTEGFFFQATLFIALAVIVQALLLTAAAWGIRRLLAGLTGSL